MNVPKYLVAQNVHGPGFTTPKKQQVLFVSGGVESVFYFSNAPCNF